MARRLGERARSELLLLVSLAVSLVYGRELW